LLFEAVDPDLQMAPIDCAIRKQRKCSRDLTAGSEPTGI
jgi:hypothetical protein